MKIAALSIAVSAFITLAVPFATVPSEVAPHGWIQPPATVPGMVTITQVPAPLNVGQAQHSAFPGLAVLPDGRIRIVWRQGSDHVASRDGSIMRATSTDGGQSYGDLLVLRSSGDYRDPSVSVINGAEFMTWFAGTNIAPAQGAWAMREWGGATRFDGGLPYAATAAPLVLLPNGLIGGAFYGRKPGEAVDTAFMAWSSDNGGSWSTNRILNSIGGGVGHAEPFLVVDGSLTHLFARWGDAGIGVRTSTNSGLPLTSGTSGWDAARQVLSNASGRPTVVAANGALVMVFRERSTGAARIAFSTDHAQTFVDGGVLLPSMGGLGMTYAAMVKTSAGIVGVVGMEQGSGTTSKLFGFRLAVA